MTDILMPCTKTHLEGEAFFELKTLRERVAAQRRELARLNEERNKYQELFYSTETERRALAALVRELQTALIKSAVALVDGVSGMNAALAERNARIKDVAGSSPAGTSTVAGSRMPEGEGGLGAQPQEVEDSRKSPQFSQRACQYFYPDSPGQRFTLQPCEKSRGHQDGCGALNTVDADR